MRTGNRRLWRQRENVYVCNRIRGKCKEILRDRKKKYFDLNRKKFTRISDSIKKEKSVLRKYKQKKTKN